jgi:hypothetical protein
MSQISSKSRSRSKSNSKIKSEKSSGKKRNTDIKPKSEHKILKTHSGNILSKIKHISKAGKLSIDSRNLKRKSNLLETLTSSIKEPESPLVLNTNKIDQQIDKLFCKFVMYYNYEDIFNIEKYLKNDDSLNDSIKTIKDKDLDFDKKLETYFNLYKIRINEDKCLVAESLEGSYLLKHAKLWIIFIKVLEQKYKFKFVDLLYSFNSALEYGADPHMLFDYFITLIQEFSEIEIFESEDKIVPQKFIEIFNENREHILNCLKKVDEDINNNQASHSSIIQELSENESEKDNKKKPIKVQLSIENTPPTKTRVHTNFEERVNTSFKKNSEIDGELFKDSIIINANIRNSGNFAVLELSEKSEKKLGYKFVLTPLKNNLSREPLSAIIEQNKDLTHINSNYPGFLYHPYDNELITEKIEAPCMDVRRLSFGFDKNSN